MRFAATNEHTMHGRRLVVILAVLCTVTLVAQAPATSGRWSEARAAQWYAAQPWLVGSNYIPATAINELEMWQAETFDPQTIDKELGWAEDLGMKTMRVFLHDLLVAAGRRRLSCADRPLPRDCRASTRSSRSSCCSTPAGTRSRGLARSTRRRLACTIQAGCRARAQGAEGSGSMRGSSVRRRGDRRVRQDDARAGLGRLERARQHERQQLRHPEPPNKVDLVLALLPQVFAWAREAARAAVDVGRVEGDWSADEKLTTMERIQLEHSDVISFHNYDKAASSRTHQWLRRYRRPILCTEYMARGNGSTFQGSLPLAKKYHVAAYQLGLRRGQDATYLPWDSWQKPYAAASPIWFHEIFKQDGTPYRQDELELIRTLTGAPGRRRALRCHTRPASLVRASPRGFERTCRHSVDVL